MFQEDLERFVADLGLSQGEVLQIAREISANDNLRSTDRMTRSEREELLRTMRALACCAIV